YRAQHTLLERTAAIKVLEPRLVDDADYVSRFLREAKVVSALRHPNIVDVFDFIETEAPRRVAFVMELLDGSTLAEVLEQRALSLDETVSAALQLCQALAAVHARGVVHRDLKPDNVMVVGPLEGGGDAAPTVKLLDFGIAKAPNPHADRTATGVMMGTPSYMAPEQFAAELPTPATDVYALAELIYEMLTQSQAFPETGLHMMRRKMSGAADLSLPATIPHRGLLLRVLQACLRAEPMERPSIADVEHELSTLPASGAPTPPPARSGSVLTRSGWIGGLAIAASLALWSNSRSSPSRNGGVGSPSTPSDASRPRVLQRVRNAELPAVIYGDPPLNTPYVATGFMGDDDALELNPDWPHNPRTGATCLRVRFTKPYGWAGLAWLDPQDDWGDLPGGLAMRGASRLSWWARSDVDGLELKVGFGLLLDDKPFYDTDRAERTLFLTTEWKEYVFDLRGKNLDRIKSPFYFALQAPPPGEPGTFYLDDIRFE
ncbi:MAG: serine/threonine-protein kinase, partial [Myxococcota bacterium]